MPIVAVKRCALVGAAVAALGSAATPASAQTDSLKIQASAQSLSLILRIRDENEAPVANAELLVKAGKLEKSARTDSSGIARVDGFHPGDIFIRVRRVGLRQTDVEARVAAGENDLVIYVDAIPTALDEVRVTERRAPVGRLEGFETRLKRGEASAVVTAAQIDKRNPVKLSSMLRGMPGLKLADSLGSIVAVSTRGQKLANGGKMLVECVYRMSLDGVILPPFANIDQIIPKDVYGVEVFNGPSRIPPGMGGLRQDSWCGLIAIWTKSG